jgi:hypothetical protein
MRRALAVLAGAVLVSVAVVGSASAANPTGYCSKTRGLPGDRLVVKGQDGMPGEQVLLEFGGSNKVIGGNTVDGYGFWRVAGTIPRHAVVGTYLITVDFATSTDFSPCYFRVVRSG